MAKMTLEEVQEAVNELSEDEKEVVYIGLLEKMERVDTEIEKVWIEEVRRRVKEYEEGRVKMVPGEQVIAEMRQRFH